MRKLTNEEIKLLAEVKHGPDGDRLYLETLEHFYKNDKEVLNKIDFLKKYLEGLDAIPYEYPSHWKTQKSYINEVDKLNQEIGFVGIETEKHFEDNFLEKIAAKVGLDVDINGDGFTSMQKYGGHNK